MNGKRIVLAGSNVTSEDVNVSEVTLRGSHVTEITDKTMRVENCSRLESEIAELQSYLDEEREKNEKQVRMTMDAHTRIEELESKVASMERTYNPARGAEELLVVVHHDTEGCSHVRPATDSDNL